MNSLQQKYNKEVLPGLKKKFELQNDLAVPKIEKVIVNLGIGKYAADQGSLDSIISDLAAITGQKPAFTQAKRAIAGFKVRQGMKVGLKTTLRGQRMFDFLDRFINIALPRSRDFRGIDQKSIDQNGNLNIGLKEQIIFPEISHEGVKVIFGLEVTVKTTAGEKEKGLELLKLMGFPIKK
ncbi:MAG: 50S ribosomal protein L5 [Candidatus Portnoybacteria bacterium]|nr:50S ribosomal protein L5 [Candidatus Portnoybacteria bacterium]